MSNDLRESLSALMDGEASELELRRILKDADPDSQAYWGRLHKQRGAMHGEPHFPALDISASVSAAIAREGAHTAKPVFEWRKPLAGVAVAASVAALVVFGLGGNPGQAGAPLVADSEAPVAVQEGGRVYLASPQTSVGAVTASVSSTPGSVPRYQHVDDQQSRKRFERFLQQHTERAALNNGQGMVTYARLVSHEAE